MLVVIPIWNTIIKIVTNCYDASNCCDSCSMYIYNYCLCIIYFCINCCLFIINPCISCCHKDHKENYNEDKQDSKNKWKRQPCCNGCLWLAILVYMIVFWGLFITILFYISRFLLGSIDLDNKTFQLVFSYITIAAFSGILAWLSTDLAIYSNDSKKSQNKSQQKQKACV